MPKQYKVQDRYFQLAKERGYRARSAFKLLDIQQKFGVIKPGDKVLDLGAAPGSFLQVILEVVGPEGHAIGIDLQKIAGFGDETDKRGDTGLGNVTLLQGDIMNTDGVVAAVKKIAGVLDVVTSDLAPKTSGIKDVDQGLSVELTDQAFYLATRLLKPGGNFVGKVFEGADLPWLVKRMKKRFKKVTLFKPPACRDRSFEKYIVAGGFLGE